MTVRLHKRYRVGLRLLDWMQGFGIRMMEGILDHVRAHNVDWDLMLDRASGGDLPAEPIGADWEGDGLIVFRHTREEAVAWRARGIRVVDLSTEIPSGSRPFPRVTMDNRAVAETAAEHFYSLGLKQLAFWHDPGRLYSQERLEHFERRARVLGCEVQVLLVPAACHPMEVRPERVAEAGWKEMSRLILPCGLFAKDDISAVCALRAARVLGIRCPQDLAIVSVNDDPIYCETSKPPLSSVRYPGQLSGQTAAALLQDLMDGKRRDDGTIHLRLPPGPLVRRESSGNIEFADAVVRKALAIIKRDAGKGHIAVADLARQVGVSRELLRQRFHHALGRGPKHEVDLARCGELESLLSNSNETLESIAESTGFSGPDDLSRFFKRMNGRSPGVFRKEFRASR